MAVVKGSKQYRLIVVPYRPFVPWCVAFAVMVIVIAVGVGSYQLGNGQGLKVEEQAVAERDKLKVELADKSRELDKLSQQVANLSLASEVDKASSEDVRQEVIDLKGQIAALEEDIGFYRGLMAPTEDQKGLTIGAVEVLATGASRQYDFKIVVQQLATNHQLLNGSLNVNIVGREATGVVSVIPIKDLSTEVGTEDIRLRFKYFQSIEGRLELPVGFTPERIEMSAQSTGRNAAQVEKKFGWLVQES